MITENELAKNFELVKTWGTYRNLGHSEVLTTVGDLRGSGVDWGGGLGLGGGVLVGEVVDHLSIELLNRLGLATAGVAALAGAAVGVASSGILVIGVVLTLALSGLSSSGGLRLRLLSNTLGQRLGRRN